MHSTEKVQMQYVFSHSRQPLTSILLDHLLALTAGVVLTTHSLADLLGWLSGCTNRPRLIIFALIYQHATEINRSTASVLSALPFGPNAQ